MKKLIIYSTARGIAGAAIAKEYFENIGEQVSDKIIASPQIQRATRSFKNVLARASGCEEVLLFDIPIKLLDEISLREHSKKRMIYVGHSLGLADSALEYFKEVQLMTVCSCFSTRKPQKDDNPAATLVSEIAASLDQGATYLNRSSCEKIFKLQKHFRDIKINMETEKDVWDNIAFFVAEFRKIYHSSPSKLFSVFIEILRAARLQTRTP